jgi:hypothetical protein
MRSLLKVRSVWTMSLDQSAFQQRVLVFRSS